VLLDTSPDIKDQIRKNKIQNVDSVIYTHEHADQTYGIFELRPFFWKNKKKIDVYGQKRTINKLKKNFDFCFTPRHGYTPIMRANIVKNSFHIKKNKNIIKINAFEVQHGLIKATGYLFNKIAYLSDCNNIDKKNIKYLENLNYLIIDCLRFKKHPSHFNLSDVLILVKNLNPQKTILTNLHVDFDYKKLKSILPKNIIPAYDGLSFNF
jgi:phosphoribosyl 1,2-cyclic phosphate phosphodiesterase|tara:strand:- start:617 stop:1243 length:627 start_codon:yes stop_codon:yes gene_type:complete